MISSEDEIVKYRGPDNEIRADLICIFKGLSVENIIEGEEDVLLMYRLAQIDEDALEKIEEMMK